MKIHRAKGGWQYWYDPSTRCWWAAQFNEQGDQLTPAKDAYTKREIKQIIDAEIRHQEV